MPDLEIYRVPDKLQNFFKNFLFPISSHATFFDSLPSYEGLKPCLFFCLKDVMRDNCQISR